MFLRTSETDAHRTVSTFASGVLQLNAWLNVHRARRILTLILSKTVPTSFHSLGTMPSAVRKSGGISRSVRVSAVRTPYALPEIRRLGPTALRQAQAQGSHRLEQEIAGAQTIYFT